MQRHSGKCDRYFPQYRLRKIETLDGRRKVVTLRRLRKNIRHIVALVAPGVHVHRRVEDAVCCVHHQTHVRHALRNSKRGAKSAFGGYISPLGYPFCPPTKTDGTPSLLKTRLLFV